MCTRHGATSAQVRTGTHSSQPIARKGTHKIKQIARVASEECVTGVYEPNMQHAYLGPHSHTTNASVDVRAQTLASQELCDGCLHASMPLDRAAGVGVYRVLYRIAVNTGL